MSAPVAPELDAPAPDSRGQRLRALLLRPSPRSERLFKMLLCALLHAGALALAAYLLAVEARPGVCGDWRELRTDLPLVVALDGCHAAVTAAPGSSRLRVRDSTVDGVGADCDTALSVSVVDCDADSGLQYLQVACAQTAPFMDGRLASVAIEVGDAVPLFNTTFTATSSQRAGVYGGAGIDFGANLYLSGGDLVASLRDFAVGALDASLLDGHLHLVGASFAAATVATESATVHVEADHALNVTVSDTADLCLHNSLGSPPDQASAVDGATSFGLGTDAAATGPGDTPTLAVTRTSAAESPQIHVSDGAAAVSFVATANNTYDSTDDAGVVVEATFADLFQRIRNDTAHAFDVVRLKVVGPGLVVEEGAEWLYSHHDVYLWYPIAYLRMLSGALMDPAVFHAVVRTTQGQCILDRTNNVALQDVCPTTSLTSTLVELTAEALYERVDVSASANSAARIVHTQSSIGSDGADDDRMLQDYTYTDTAAVTSFDVNSGRHYASHAESSDTLVSSFNRAFTPLNWVVSLLVASLLLLSALRFGAREKRKFELLHGKQEFGDRWDTNNAHCRAKIGPIFFIEHAVLNTLPSFESVSGYPAAVVSVVLHWTVLWLSTTPLIVVGFLVHTSNVAIYYCPFEALLQGECPGSYYVPTYVAYCLSGAFLLYAGFYCCAYYAEFDESPPHLVSSTMTAQPWFHQTFYAVWGAMAMATVVYCCNLFAWLCLGAMIDPNRYVGIVVAIIAVFLCLRSTYQSLRELRTHIKENVHKVYAAAGKAVSKKEMQDALSRAGCGKRQIWAILFSLVAIVVGLVLFVYIGLSMFVTDEVDEIFSTVVRSAVILLTAFAAMKARTPDTSRAGEFRLTRKVMGVLTTVDKEAAAVDKAVAGGEDARVLAHAATRANEALAGVLAPAAAAPAPAPAPSGSVPAPASAEPMTAPTTLPPVQS